MSKKIILLLFLIPLFFANHNILSMQKILCEKGSDQRIYTLEKSGTQLLALLCTVDTMNKKATLHIPTALVTSLSKKEAEAATHDLDEHATTELIKDGFSVSYKIDHEGTEEEEYEEHCDTSYKADEESIKELAWGGKKTETRYMSLEYSVEYAFLHHVRILDLKYLLPIFPDLSDRSTFIQDGDDPWD